LVILLVVTIEQIKFPSRNDSFRVKLGWLIKVKLCGGNGNNVANLNLKLDFNEIKLDNTVQIWMSEQSCRVSDRKKYKIESLYPTW
jgi:hypothetical protein